MPGAAVRFCFCVAGVLIFESELAAKQAALLPGPLVLGWQVYVASSNIDNGLYLWELPPSVVESDLWEYYAHAGLKEIKFKMTDDYSTSVGVVASFQSFEAVMAALKMGPPQIRGSKCRMKFLGCRSDKEVHPCVLVCIHLQ